MNTPRSLHIEASKLYSQAKLALENDDALKHTDLLAKAFEKFKEATILLSNNYAAEPTRSVMFRSAASIAIQLGEFDQAEYLIYQALAGTPPIEIKEELKTLYRDFLLNDLLIESSTGQDVAYLMDHRAKALNLQVKPSGVNSLQYRRGVLLGNIKRAISLVESYWRNYVFVNCKKDLIDVIKGDIENIAMDLASRLPLFSVNQKFASFGISISCDPTVMFKGDGLPREIMDWNTDLFEKFKGECFYSDFNDESFLTFLENRYSPEERAIVFTPFMELVDSQKKFQVCLTDANFHEVTRELKPVSKVNKSRIIPLSTKTTPDVDVELHRAFYIVSSNKGKKEFFEDETLTKGEFSKTLKDIVSGETTLILKEPLAVQYFFENRSFNLTFEELGVMLYERSAETLIEKFKKRFVEIYTSVKAKAEADLSLPEKNQLAYLDQVVFTVQTNRQA